MDVLAIKFLREMSLGIIFMLAAAILIVLSPALMAYHALRRMSKTERR